MIDPEKYESNKSVAARDAAESVPKIISLMQWQMNENILDYGCGAGSTGYNLILPQVESFNSKMYSVDISTTMLEFAKKKYPHPRITYAEGEILQNFPFENVEFDKVFAVYVFHFIQDIRGALRNFIRIIKPGGYLGFALVPQSYFFRSFRQLGESEDWKDYMKGYQEKIPEWMNYEEGKGKEVFTDLLESADFRIVHLDVQQKRTFRFHNVDTYLELYLSLNHYYKTTIPEDLRPNYKEDLRKIVTGYAKVPLDSDTITSTYEFVLVVAQKI